MPRKHPAAAPMVPALQLERRALDTLALDPNNARRHPQASLDAIAASLARYGQQRPIVVDTAGVIRAGEGVYLAARALELAHLDVVVSDLSEAELKAYAIADNRTSELSLWDTEQLATTLAEIQQECQVTLDATGFAVADIDRLFAELAGGAAPAAPQPRARGAAETAEEPPELQPPAVPLVREGELWRLGGHVLVCGDCHEESTRTALLAGERAAMALCDPPFAIYGSSTGVGSDVADNKAVAPLFHSLARAVVSSVARHAHAYVCSDWRSIGPMTAACARGGLELANVLVWDKGDFGLGSMYRNCHELVGFFVAAPRRTSHYKAREAGRRTVMQPNVLRFARTGTGGWEAAREPGQRWHNAAKPVDLLSHLIRNSSDDGETVLDLFAGSGSTLLAAHATGRRALCAEIEPSWCDVIVQRWQALTGETAVGPAGETYDSRRPS